MAKYLILADGHFSHTLRPAEIESLQRLAQGILGKDSRLAKKLSRHYGKHQLDHLDRAFNQMGNSGPFDGLISLGDHYYDWDSVGINSNDKIDEAQQFKNQLLNKFELDGKHHIWIPGNHDLGFLNSSFCVGPTLPSIENFSSYQNIYGPASGLNQISDHFWIAWISTAHIEAFWIKSKQQTDKNYAWLINRQKEELEFLDERLEKINGQFFFGAHDPASFLSPPVRKVLDRHMDKLAGSFTGHLHADWLMKLNKLYRPKLYSAFNRYKVNFIPSIWGIVMPINFRTTGAGWAGLEISGHDARITRCHIEKNNYKSR